jgi:protein gp37
MGDKTGIEWTDATWNPIAGCSLVSPGCTNCYAMNMAARLEAMAAGSGRETHYAGTTKPSKAGAVWTGKINLAPAHILTQPLRWKRPRKIFVNSMSDLFHENVPDVVIDRVFGIMSLTPQHTYQVLTKRPERMRAYLSEDRPKLLDDAFLRCDFLPYWDSRPCFVQDDGLQNWPLPNVWLGVSVEDQKRADERIQPLLDTPAAVRFLSCEPLLGPVDISYNLNSMTTSREYGVVPRLDWVIVGGESGHGARPMLQEWARSLRDQCDAGGVPFFFKQWGEWAPIEDDTVPGQRQKYSQSIGMKCVGKHKAGNLLDGQTWQQFPERKAA